MAWPAPFAGLVIRYAYLWKSEFDAGRTEGVKDRPAVIVLAQQRVADGVRVVVAPVTHAPPREAADAVELPEATCRRIGLDSDRKWVVVSEVNAFLWPGPDLRPLPGAGPESVVIGALPASLTRRIQERLASRIRVRALRLTERS